MNGTLCRVTRPGAGTIALAATALLAAGCGKDDFAKVNGQAITREEYIQALERAPVSVPGAPPAARVNAGRYVLDQLIGRKVVTAEASKLNVNPTDADVQQRYDVQKKILEQQMPGKAFEAAMKEQGTTPEEIKEEMRAQLAETNLLAKRMNITEDEIKKAYEQAKGQMGLPERAQLRVVVAPADSKEFKQAQKMLANKTDFQEVVRQTNPAPLKANGGLLPQPIPVAQMPPAWQARYKQTAEGAHFGPVDWPAGPGQKAWIHVDKKMPPFTLSPEEAKPLIKQQLVQARLQDPQNAAIRNDILTSKLKADFKATDPKYQTVWQAVKQAAETAGGGQTAGEPTPVSALPASAGR